MCLFPRILRCPALLLRFIRRKEPGRVSKRYPEVSCFTVVRVSHRTFFPFSVRWPSTSMPEVHRRCSLACLNEHAHHHRHQSRFHRCRYGRPRLTSTSTMCHCQAQEVQRVLAGWHRHHRSCNPRSHHHCRRRHRRCCSCCPESGHVVYSWWRERAGCMPLQRARPSR